MKKYLPFVVIVAIVIAARLTSRANPLDVPTGTTVVAVSSTTVTLTTATFQSSAYRWCLEHVVVSAPSVPYSFTVFSSTNNPPLTTGTTNYMVTLSTGYYESQWSYHRPFCIPTNSIMVMQSSVSGSTITYEAYTFKGWNP